MNCLCKCFLLNQAECDELAQRAEALKEENANLRSEVNRIKSEYEQLLAENTSLKVIFCFCFVLQNFKLVSMFLLFELQPASSAHLLA